ncbi:phenylacetate--CoA ligase family protein [Chondromyces apiculatus]|uniref:Coenzyme F390 synthetase n=1 Tax=Chondromyces apiculatus DSM 436 TaxID=1192034 RepID=A0A017SZX0_9BACT|nr:phenylacetate--CoA ligase family protein [Chondromyces apiculatus]EYF02312.1 Coenzyme F390 synthetase [Chondromyces apiculatus DSM 436]
MYASLFRHVLFPLYETRLRGRETLTRLQELERSQWRSEADLRELSFRRVVEAIRYAEQHVPLYRRRFADHGVRARDVQSPDDLLRFPVLTKSDIRKHGKELIAEGFHGKMYQSGTGGSTGEPIQFSYDHRTYESRIAAAMRADGWAGASPGERELHIWSRATTPETPLRKAKRRAHETILRKRMICAWELGQDQLADLCDTIEDFQPRVIISYPTPLYHLSRYALEKGRRLPSPRGIVTSAERLFQHHREVIERAFDAKIFDRYGCREVMLIASECERHEGKHLNLENVHVEIVRSGRHAGAGEPGEVILTDLNCRSMPLIRYKNEDVATLAPKPCSCGRGMPMLSSVEGRMLDMIVGPEGQLLAGEFFPHLLKDYRDVARFQVHQDKSRAITIKLMPNEGLAAETPARVERSMREFLGERASIKVEVVDDIPLTKGGKYRLTVSEVPVDLEREATA